MRVLAWDVGVIHLAYCLLEEDSAQIIQWGLLDLLEERPDTKIKDLSISELKTLMIKKLDQIKDQLLPCDLVIIENQPVLKNPTMKAVASCLFDFFLIRGKVDSDLISIDVMYTSPINKLKCGILPPEEIDALKKRYKSRYTVAKKLATRTCEVLVGPDHPTLCKSKKKDDLADAFLLAYHHLFIKKGNQRSRRVTRRGHDDNTQNNGEISTPRASVA